MSAERDRLADAVQFLDRAGYIIEPRRERFRPHCPDADWILTGGGSRDLLSDADLVEMVANIRWLHSHTTVIESELTR